MRHNINMQGQRSGARRQIDIAIYESGGSTPILVVEVKRQARPIDLVSSGATIALVRDIGQVPAVMVSITGFSRAAKRHLLWEGIEHMTITPAEAKGLRWIPVIEQRFGLDRWFREVSGDLFEAMRVREVAPFLDSDIPYEEWIATIEAGLSMFPKETIELLRYLAGQHPDDGVRFNAVQMLVERDGLDRADILRLLSAEIDPDLRLLLEAALGQSGSPSLRE